MKKVLVFAFLTCAALGQTALPNLSYNALLNATCSTPNAFCAGSVLAFPTLAQTGQNGTALDVPAVNYAMATVTVSGTYTGATVNFDFSDPSGGISYFQELCARTDVNIIESSEILPSNQIRSWQCPVFATYRFRVRVSAISTGSINTWITLSQTSVDPSPTEANLPSPSPSSTTAFTDFANASVTTSVNVKASTGNLYGFQVTNGNASICWVQFINSAGAGTLGTGAVFSFQIPASGTVTVGPGDIALGNFSAGIAVGFSTTFNGAAACAAGSSIVAFYN